jgi:hypothetical protein
MAGVIRRTRLASFVVVAYAVSWAWMLPFVAAGDVVKKGRVRAVWAGRVAEVGFSTVPPTCPVCSR